MANWRRAGASVNGEARETMNGGANALARRGRRPGRAPLAYSAAGDALDFLVDPLLDDRRRDSRRAMT